MSQILNKHDIISKGLESRKTKEVDIDGLGKIRIIEHTAKNYDVLQGYLIESSSTKELTERSKLFTEYKKYKVQCSLVDANNNLLFDKDEEFTEFYENVNKDIIEKIINVISDLNEENKSLEESKKK